MNPVQRLLCTLTPVQYKASFSAGEVGHLNLLSVAYGIVQDSTWYTPFLTRWLRASLESFLNLIISFFVQLQHLLIPSLIVTSSQVRVGMPLPLLQCCISGLGLECLKHNCTISVVSPGSTQGDPCIFLGETLPTRTFHAKLNGQSAVSTRCPSTLQHPLAKQVMSSRTYKNQNVFWFTSNAFLKRPILLKYWLLRPLSTRKPLAKAVPSKDYFLHMKP